MNFLHFSKKISYDRVRNLHSHIQQKTQYKNDVLKELVQSNTSWQKIAVLGALFCVAVVRDAVGV